MYLCPIYVGRWAQVQNSGCQGDVAPIKNTVAVLSRIIMHTTKNVSYDAFTGHVQQLKGFRENTQQVLQVVQVIVNTVVFFVCFLLCENILMHCCLKQQNYRRLGTKRLSVYC